MSQILYRLDWDAGRTAVLDLMNTAVADRESYMLRYTPPFRATVSSGLIPRPLSAPDRRPIDDRVDKIASRIGPNRMFRGPKADPGGGQGPAGQAVSLLSEATELGRQLYDKLVHRIVQADLKDQAGLYLDVRLEDSLLDYPWELMHDGQDFLCLKHRMGRFINSSSVSMPRPDGEWWGTKPEPLSALLVAVPDPGRGYEPLKQAETEADEIAKILSHTLLNVRLDKFVGSDATFDAIDKKLSDNNKFDSDNRYRIIHFCGHCNFDTQEPRNSLIALKDTDMTIGNVVDSLSVSRPILCFINACSSAASSRNDSKGLQEIFRRRSELQAMYPTFLQSGAYLLGTQWEIGDDVAGVFAREFYTSLLFHNDSLGEAIRNARVECRNKDPDPDHLDWAAYVFYGDPRVQFRRERIR